MLLSAPPSVDLRLLTADDWAAVADIYWDGMRDGLATFETEVPPWNTWDAAHLPDHRLVAERLGEVVGWSALASACSRSQTIRTFWLRPPRPIPYRWSQRSRAFRNLSAR